jgi:Uri superfamily endonuclease
MPVLPPPLTDALPPPDQLTPSGSETGAYLIAIHLAQARTVERPRSAVLAAGCYIFAGNAHGPGGLAARIARHLKPNKRRRWHVDAVTAGAAEVSALAYRGRGECDLISELLATGAFSTPLHRFGSSDCRSCAAHLVYWTGGRLSRP